MISSAMLKKLSYRPCVGAMVFNAGGKVWVGRRSDVESDENAWQMPQGGIDEGETPYEAVIRECGEEMGTNNVELLAESSAWYTYDLPAELIGSVWKGKFRGQKQRWFALRFLGHENEIDIHTTKHSEFSDWRWADIEEIPNLIIAFKRPVYERVVEEFRPWAGTI
ncbi:MAG: RNA pyrophosphohydrolase [Rhodospirillales bacterium]|jgi:putative (di)nucleoside polyphosphate hydrolase